MAVVEHDPIAAERRVDTFTSHRAHLEAVATRILRDPEEAQDVASDAFVALIERGPVDDAAVVPWLFVTTRNRALKRLRDRTRAGRRPLPVAVPAPDPSSAVASASAADLVLAASAALSERDRTAVRLRLVEQRDYDAIAAALGTSERTARVVVHRATRRLRREAALRLARHHGAPSACVAALARAAADGDEHAHDGCRPCASVAEELQALASQGAIPLAPLAPMVEPSRLGVLDRLGAWLGPRLPVPTSGGGRSALEAAASVAVAGLMAAGALAPSTSPADAPPSQSDPPVVGRLDPAAPLEAAVVLPPPVVVAVDVATDDGAGDVAAGVSVDPTAAIGDGAAVAADVDVEQEALAGPPVVYEDRSGDPGTAERLVGMTSEGLLGEPVVVEDPLDDDSGASDIRRFEVATLADDDGAPRALRYRIRFAGPMTASQDVQLRWGYFGDATSCTASLTIAQGADGTVDGDGFGRDGVFTGSYDDACAEGGSSLELMPVIRGDLLEIEIPFATVAAQAGNDLIPGVELEELTVVSMDLSPLRITTYDAAPEEGGLRYRVGAGPDHR